MRFLHTADLHLGRSLEGQNRAEEQWQLIAELIDLAERHQVDVVLLAGDIYDTFNPTAEAEQMFYQLLSGLNAGGKRAVVAIAGNHDQPERLAAAGPISLNQGIFLLGRPNQVIETFSGANAEVKLLEAGPNWLKLTVQGQTAVIVTLPYTSEARLNEVLVADIGDEALLKAAYNEKIAAMLQAGALHFGQDSCNIIMAHLYMAGQTASASERQIQIGGAYGVHYENFPACDYIALGHLHRPQQPFFSCCYAGSPLAFSFSEAGEAKSVNLVEINPGAAAKIELLPLSAGYPLVRQDFPSYDAARAWCADPENLPYWVELSINMPRPLQDSEFKELKALHPRLAQIHCLTPEVEANLDWVAAADLPIEAKFKLFAAKEEGAEPDAALVDLFLELLNQAE